VLFLFRSLGNRWFGARVHFMLPPVVTRRVLLAVLAGLAACSDHAGVRPRPVVPAAAPTAPDLDALRALLAPHAGLHFDASANTRGCPEDQTLGEYVTLLAQYGERGEDPTDVHRFSGGCRAAPPAGERMAIDPPTDPAYWFCRIDSYLSDAAGESPWHYELRLRVRRADAAPDLSTLACPGAP
jgi:hypothetical protein